MRTTLVATMSLAAGITGALLGRRYAAAFLWWIFTTDVRHTR